MRKNLNSTKKIISFDKVNKIYLPTKEVALRDFSLEITPGEFVCIIGPSGCGKSTVLKLIAGIETPTSGKLVRPENVSMVFQSGALFPWLTVYQNVALPLSVKKRPASAISELTMRYVEMMGLRDFVEKYPRDLSGGQRQRVGIARALVVEPKVLILDEPFSALDLMTTEELHKDVLKIWKQTKTTIVMVSHLVEEAVALADRIVLMKNFQTQDVFAIDLACPRRELAESFEAQVRHIRHHFLTEE